MHTFWNIENGFFDRSPISLLSFNARGMNIHFIEKNIYWSEVKTFREILEIAQLSAMVIAHRAFSAIGGKTTLIIKIEG